MYGYEELGVSVAVHVCCSNSTDRLDESIVDQSGLLVAPVVAVLACRTQHVGAPIIGSGQSDPRLLLSA